MQGKGKSLDASLQARMLERNMENRVETVEIIKRRYLDGLFTEIVHPLGGFRVRWEK